MPRADTATNPPECLPEEALPLSASRLTAAGLNTPPERENNSSPGISIDNSQSPTTSVLSTASVTSSGSNQSPIHLRMLSISLCPLQRSDFYTVFAVCSLHLISAGSLPWILILVPESRLRMIEPLCFLFRAECNLRYAKGYP